MHQPQVGSLNCYAIIRSIGSKLPSCVRLSCWQYVGDSETRCCILSLWFSDGDYKPEILSRIAHTTAALTRLKPVWIDRSISLSSKIRLVRSLVTSIFLYACESWSLTAELQRRIQATEMRCNRKILRISYKDHVTNEEVRAKVQQAVGPHEDLLTIEKKNTKCSGIDICSVHQVWPNHLAKHSERETVQTEEEVGRQHQGMDRSGVRQVPDSSVKKRRKLVVKSSVVPQ